MLHGKHYHRTIKVKWYDLSRHLQFIPHKHYVTHFLLIIEKKKSIYMTTKSTPEKFSLMKSHTVFFQIALAKKKPYFKKYINTYKLNNVHLNWQWVSERVWRESVGDIHVPVPVCVWLCSPLRCMLRIDVNIEMSCSISLYGGSKRNTCIHTYIFNTQTHMHAYAHNTHVCKILRQGLSMDLRLAVWTR